MAPITFQIDTCKRSDENCINCKKVIKTNDLIAFHEIVPLSEEKENKREKNSHFICFICFDNLLKSCIEKNVYPYCPADNLISENLIPGFGIPQRELIKYIQNLFENAVLKKKVQEKENDLIKLTAQKQELENHTNELLIEQSKLLREIVTKEEDRLEKALKLPLEDDEKITQLKEELRKLLEENTQLKEEKGKLLESQKK